MTKRQFPNRYVGAGTLLAWVDPELVVEHFHQERLAREARAAAKAEETNRRACNSDAPHSLLDFVDQDRI